MAILNIGSSVLVPNVANAVTVAQKIETRKSMTFAMQGAASNVAVQLGIAKSTSVKTASSEDAARGIFPGARTKKVWITAYSSSPDETDDTPFLTASGEKVRVGIVAANFVPLGTKIRIPELFGKETFVVEDRMHPRHSNGVDIWMPTKNQALRFGANYTEIIILD